MSNRLSALLLLLLVSGLPAIARSEEPEATRLGTFKLDATPAQLLGTEGAAELAGVLPPEEAITWSLYVPQDYSPGHPAGLMVFISASRSGRTPRDWKPVMDEANMIWIGADRSGNQIPVVRRALHALLAPTLVARRYRIDPARVYLSGFSGGAKVAGMVAANHAGWFRGAIYMGGAAFWDDQLRAQPEEIRTNRYVFLVGSQDRNRDLVRRVHQRYLGAGVQASRLMVVQRLAHRFPDARRFAEALAFLDSDTLP